MIRAIVVFAVVISVIAEVRAQDGDGDGSQCGMMSCSDSQCCVNNMMCMTKPGENGRCFMYGLGCDCPDGYECTSSRSWGMMGTCQLPSSESRQGMPPIPTGFPTGLPF